MTPADARWCGATEYNILPLPHEKQEYRQSLIYIKISICPDTVRIEK